MSAQQSGRRVGGRWIVLGLGALLVAVFMSAVVAPFVFGEDPPPLEVLGTVPEAEFTDHTGASFSTESLRGKVVIANFVFTRCVVACPTFTMKMRQVQERTVDAGGDIKLISWTVDPQHDTPEVLARYAADQGAKDDRWRFLTGDQALIQKIATEGLKLGLEQNGEQADGAPNILHSERFILIDRDLQIRGYYDYKDPKRVERLVRDAHRLARER